MTEEQRHLHNKLYEQAMAIARPQLLIHDLPKKAKPGWWLRRKLKKSLSLFRNALTLNPENWPAMWTAGKVCQRLGDNNEALSWFEQAYQINPSQPDVAREASLASMNIGRNDVAIIYAYRATQIEPSNAGLHANLALAYVLANRLADAEASVNHSITLDSNDTISHTLKTMIKYFITTGCTPPTTSAELQQFWKKNRPR